ncbi:MAG TPA: response regulator transcription factor [Chloroflexia bacterium]|nr:response regulator transcription factor [Chloroflexia bacterium]
MNGLRILIVDDEPAIARALRPALQAHDFQVAVATTGAEGLAEVARFRPHLILLDLGLPDIDGVTLVGELRQQTSTPIIIVSVRGADRDKIAALDRGADDYLTKPFSVGELLARIRVALRHQQQTPATTAASPVLTNGALVLDPARHQVTLRGAPVHLSPTEFHLLEILMAHAGKVITHGTLLHKVWGAEYAGETQLLRVYIGQLRGKIEERPQRPTYIQTEPGIGYRFREPEET